MELAIQSRAFDTFLYFIIHDDIYLFYQFWLFPFDTMSDSDSTEQITRAGCSSWCWAGDTTDCSTAAPRPAAGSRSLQTQHSLPARDGAQPSPAQPSPAHAVSSPQIMSDGVLSPHCYTAALQHCSTAGGWMSTFLPSQGKFRHIYCLVTFYV